MNAVIFCRVSTENQELDRQINTLKQWAKMDGYDEDNQILIAFKESAIKLRGEDREGLQELFKQIETGEVAVIYAWELSRIGRQLKDIITVRDICVDKKVQLKTYTEKIELLDNEGRLTSTASVVTSIMGTLAEQEMKIKKERLLSGRKESAKKGNFIGGTISFGYKVNKNNEIVEDPETAPIVKEIFTRYATENISLHQLARSLREKNYKTAKGGEWGMARIFTILSCEHYIGKSTELGTKYPAIISKDIFDKVKEKREANRAGIEKTRTGLIWYGLKLLKCVKCGNNYMICPQNNKGVKKYFYKCSRKRSDIYKCDGESIEAKLFDKILWYCVRWEYDRRINDPEVINVELERLNSYKTELEQRIKGCTELLSDKEKQLERAELLFIKGSIKEARFDAIKADIEAETKDMIDNINSLKESLEATEKSINNYKSESTDYRRILLISLDNDNSDEARMKKKEIIQDYVRLITLELENDKKLIRIFFKDREASVNFYVVKRIGKSSIVLDSNQNEIPDFMLS